MLREGEGVTVCVGGIGLQLARGLGREVLEFYTRYVTMYSG